MTPKHDIRIDRKKLHPWLDYKLTRFLNKCAKQGLYLIITEGFRTVQYQDELYAKGRTKPGNKVTNARGRDYSSQHQWGIAFDIAINDPKKLYNDTLMKKAGYIGKMCGLGWGGDWKSIVDLPHFYLTPWGSTTVALKKAYKTPDIFMKTWHATVIRKKGLNIYKDTSRTEVLTHIPYKTNVDVLFESKQWYAKVRYKDKVGYIRKAYLK